MARKALPFTDEFKHFMRTCLKVKKQVLVAKRSFKSGHRKFEKGEEVTGRNRGTCFDLSANIGGKLYIHRLHRVVYFCGNGYQMDEDLVVSHKDGDATNNRFNNLYAITNVESCALARWRRDKVVPWTVDMSARGYKTKPFMCQYWNHIQEVQERSYHSTVKGAYKEAYQWFKQRYGRAPIFHEEIKRHIYRNGLY